MTNGIGAELIDLKVIFPSKKASIEAINILGFEWAPCYDFNDNAMDQHSVLDVTGAIEKVKEIYQPNLVYTHSASLNIDHRVVSHAVLTAFRLVMENCQK